MVALAKVRRNRARPCRVCRRSSPCHWGSRYIFMPRSNSKFAAWVKRRSWRRLRCFRDPVPAHLRQGSADDKAVDIGYSVARFDVGERGGVFIAQRETAINVVGRGADEGQRFQARFDPSSARLLCGDKNMIATATPRLFFIVSKN